MQIVNARDVEESHWSSPSRRFEGYDKNLSEALGRERDSTDLMKRHPFDVEIARLPPGAKLCPYHSHSAQWEFFSVIAGNGHVRHAGGTTPIDTGDTFLFKPGEAHQIANDGDADLLLFIVADNPLGESCYYPDSGKWGVRSPEMRLLRSEPLDYYDGED